MTMNRAQRRAFKHKAQTTAARMAGRCYYFEGPALVHVTDPRAIAALTRAFTISLRFGGKPVALQIGEVEAAGFPVGWLTMFPAASLGWPLASIPKAARPTRCSQPPVRIGSKRMKQPATRRLPVLPGFAPRRAFRWA